MHLVAIIPGVIPFCRDTWSARLVSSLASALIGRSHQVTLLAPLADGVQAASVPLARRLRPIPTHVGSASASYRILEATLPSKVRIVLLETLETSAQDPDSLEAWSLFSAASLALLGQTERSPDAVLVQGWKTGLFAGLARSSCNATPALADLPIVSMTDHPFEEGRFPRDQAERLGLTDGALPDSDFSALSMAARHADVIVVDHTDLIPRVEGLGPGRVMRIPPWVDACRGMPAGARPEHKATLQYRLGLEVRTDVPLFSVLLDAESGAQPDTAPILPLILSTAILDPIQIAVVCRSPAHGLETLAARFGDRLAVIQTEDVTALQQVQKASDFTLFHGPHPDSFAILRSLASGSLPILPQGHGLEAIVDMDPAGTSGTGFEYADQGPVSILSALRRAQALFYRSGNPMSRIQMLPLDVGPDRPAALFEQAFAEARTRRHVSPVVPDVKEASP